MGGNNFLGLDLSLTSTGYSSGHDRNVITTKTRGAERLYIISSTIIKICEDLDITAVAIEGYSFASRNSQAHSIGELGGVVRMRMWEEKIPFVEIPPTSRAKFATARGNAGKTEVMSAISAKTGLVFSGSGADDICDAYILEEMIRAKCGNSRHQWSSAQMSALDKIDWQPIESLLTTTVKDNCASNSNQSD